MIELDVVGTVGNVIVFIISSAGAPCSVGSPPCAITGSTKAGGSVSGGMMSITKT